MKYLINHDRGFVELYFDESPPVEKRDEMKSLGWWYHWKGRYWYNFINDDNIDYAQKTCNHKNARVIIDFSDIVVLSGRMRCDELGHGDTETLNASIHILRRAGEVTVKEIVVGYCPVCNRYFAQYDDVERLKVFGIIIARIIDPRKISVNAYDWNAESLLMQVGYSVSQERNLSVKQRQEILANVMDSGLMSAYEIINHLDFVINMRISRPQYAIAIEKWQRDRIFVSAYKSSNRKSIDVNYNFTDHPSIRNVDETEAIKKQRAKWILTNPKTGFVTKYLAMGQ